MPEGKTNAQIATGLCMSVRTVKSHVSHILTELESNNRGQIALLVYQAGLLRARSGDEQPES